MFFLQKSLDVTKIFVSLWCKDYLFIKNISVMKKLFTLETIEIILIILAFALMFIGVIVKSFTLLVIGVFIVLIPLGIVVLLD